VFLSSVLAAALSYGTLIKERCVEDIFANFGSVWHELVHEEQLRWVG